MVDFDVKADEVTLSPKRWLNDAIGGMYAVVIVAIDSSIGLIETFDFVVMPV